MRNHRSGSPNSFAQRASHQLWIRRKVHHESRARTRDFPLDSCCCHIHLVIFSIPASAGGGLSPEGLCLGGLLFGLFLSGLFPSSLFSVKVIYYCSADVLYRPRQCIDRNDLQVCMDTDYHEVCCGVPLGYAPGTRH